MRILAIADEADKMLWDMLDRTLLEGVDLILSAGDLPAEYLSFLTCFTHAPILYVHGNHDTKYSVQPPEGCICCEDDIIEVDGLRILGLGGSMRYREGPCMYSENEMRKRIRKLRFKLKKHNGFDILLAHAPLCGIGDKPDPAHLGFVCFKELCDKFSPKAVVHGHIHKAYSFDFKRELSYNGVRIINASGRTFIDI